MIKDYIIVAGQIAHTKRQANFVLSDELRVAESMYVRTIFAIMDSLDEKDTEPNVQP
ncbi:MAG: hypothetical protein RLZZ628_535 [Bacteroidota bacterium]